MSTYIMASEYVSKGHPDKVADQISDMILDAFLDEDKDAKVACETMVKGNRVYIAGEITSTATVSEFDIKQEVREAILEAGYHDVSQGFCASTCVISIDISQQSPEINRAVVGNGEMTAGDQGIMFGFATRETPTYMPIASYLSKLFIQEADRIGGYYPDKKSQVALVYENGVPVAIDSVVLSVCHTPDLTMDDLRDIFECEILREVYEEVPDNIKKLFHKNVKYHINPAGLWTVGGPVSDCGLTGRKIVVDQYGADCEIGGGAFSGKDFSKVDRSAAYMARHIALRTLHENEDANKIKVQLAYAIGEKYPVSCRIYDPTTNVEYGLGDLTLDDLTPSAIIDRLDLKRPIYHRTAKEGHFGISDYSWEKYE